MRDEKVVVETERIAMSLFTRNGFRVSRSESIHHDFNAKLGKIPFAVEVKNIGHDLRLPEYAELKEMVDDDKPVLLVFVSEGGDSLLFKAVTMENLVKQTGEAEILAKTEQKPEILIRLREVLGMSEIFGKGRTQIPIPVRNYLLARDADKFIWSKGRDETEVIVRLQHGEPRFTKTTP